MQTNSRPLDATIMTILSTLDTKILTTNGDFLILLNGQKSLTKEFVQVCFQHIKMAISIMT